MASTLWFTQPLGSAFSGAKLYHYAPGTSTLKDVYPTKADADAGTNALAQPVVLDSVGWAQVWLDGTYKLVLKNSAESTTYYTADNVGDSSDENARGLYYIAGLEVTANATDSDHDLDIAVGVARDGADSADIELTSALVKQLDATWAAGTGAGAMQSGSSLSASTWYYIWAIYASGTGDVDVLASTSSSSPTLPSGYDKKRLIAKVRTDASANIVSVDGTVGRLRSDPLDAHGWEFVREITGGGSSYDFTDGISPDFDLYMVVLTDLRPANDGDDFYIRLRDATLEAFQSDANDYEYSFSRLSSDSTTYAAVSSQSATLILGANAVGNASSDGLCGSIFIRNPSLTTSRCYVDGTLDCFDNSATPLLRRFNFVGAYNAVQNPIDGVRFLFSTGNIASGSAALYRLRKG